ncbi:ABC transporter permease [Corynebacterium heidelbergense]|uniref:ABC transporter permease n=1 Tax=Corynebacterium heidelbergense TaxID=2055947 RepID=UPI0011BED149|nr:ABC transporter permease [Corynebacterium heidelbergense]WCZ37533.1 hypothetical protein CHEID_10045 [Corynebacterium heidelbergense]
MNRPGRDSPWAVALRVAARSTPALANSRTAATSLVLLPLLEVLLLLSVVASMRLPDGVLIADAGLVVSSAGVVAFGGVTAVTRDRALGVLADVITTRPLSPRYWVSRFAPVAAFSAATSLCAATGVFIADPAHDSHRYALTLLCAIPLAIVVGACAGIVCCVAAIAWRDPFLLSNLLAAAFPVTAGVLLEHAHYPVVVRQIVGGLPLTWLVQFLRDATSGAPAGVTLGHLGLELVVDGLWLAAGVGAVLMAARVMLRDGRTLALM